MNTTRHDRIHLPKGAEFPWNEDIEEYEEDVDGNGWPDDDDSEKEKKPPPYV